MVLITRLNNKGQYINPHLIEVIESNPDTTLTLVNEKKIVIKETVSELLKRIIDYRRSIGIEISA